MPFVGARMSNIFSSLLAGRGFRGPRLRDFTDACGLGSQKTIVGKTFNTVDVGSVPGTGVGTGTGLFNIPLSVVANGIISVCAGFGFRGPLLPAIAQDYASSLVNESGKTTLSSTHSPVFLGTGTVVPGSIPVVDVEWGNNIFSIAQSRGFIGPRWSQFAFALGVGSVRGYKTATGTVAIVGSPSGIPVGGGGTGVGVLS